VKTAGIGAVRSPVGVLALNKLVGGTDSITREGARSCLFPHDRDEFKHGQVHGELLRIVDEAVGQERSSRLAKPVGNAIARAYHRLWTGYTDLLADRKLDLDSRLRDEYDTSTRNIRRHFVIDTG